jgi:hypothetical protein
LRFSERELAMRWKSRRIGSKVNKIGSTMGEGEGTTWSWATRKRWIPLLLEKRVRVLPPYRNNFQQDNPHLSATTSKVGEGNSRRYLWCAGE